MKVVGSDRWWWVGGDGLNFLLLFILGNLYKKKAKNGDLIKEVGMCPNFIGV